MERHHTSRCVHRWVISETVRGRVRGVCRRCGAQRWYPAYLSTVHSQPDKTHRPTAPPPALASGLVPQDELDLRSDLPLDSAAISLSETRAVW